VNGDHTRVVNISTPSVGGLMRFTVKTATCLGCKAALPKGYTFATCQQCIGRVPELYQYQLDIFNKRSMRFSRLWTQCQRCQESLHQDVLCSNNDCPIFYMRTKAQKDLEESQARLDRFEMDRLHDW
jgi:DNA polymerase delta subunit 1